MTPNNLVHENERLDELHRNGYYIIQDPARFCFGMDAVLLSGFARARRGERVLDLGTGTGIIPILMEAKTEAEDFTALEIQEESADMARRSVLYNHLEEKIRDWAIADSAIIIICGPIIEKHPKTIGKNKVVVPQKFFKVVLSPFVKPMRAIGFLFNNEQAVEPLSSYTVTIDSIESLTNMDFFAPLPDEIENKIEADINYSLWPN